MLSELLPGSDTLLRGLVDLADDVGEVLLFLTWIAVSAAILGCAWLVAQVFGGPRPPTHAGAWSDAYQRPETPVDASTPHGDLVDAAMRRLGRGAPKVGTLKRLPGQDYWRA
jgi:hypothetical protein